jgi:hypothetical protein
MKEEMNKDEHSLPMKEATNKDENVGEKST